MIKKFEDFIGVNEVIGPDRRCTNLVLESFGICVDRAVMNRAMLLKALRQKYPKNELKEYTTHNEAMYLSYKTRTAIWDKALESKQLYIAPMNIQHYWEPLGWGFKKTTIRNFAKMISDERIYGHFVVEVPAHVLAIHHTRKHGMVVVDTEMKFLSTKRVTGLNIVDEGPKPNYALENFLKTTDRQEQIRKY